MIPRYQTKEIGAIFSDVHRMQVWLDVEVMVSSAMAHFGIIPHDDAAHIVANAPTVDDAFVDDVLEREEITNHDLAAFVDIAQARIGVPQGAWLHYGLTSSDVVDTAFSMLMCDALDVVIAEVRAATVEVARVAREHAGTVMVGRTHGIHAEPTVFGAKVALWALQLERDLVRLRTARDGISVGKLSGAVGTYSNIEPEVEAYALERLHLRPVPSTQVIARDRHGEVMYALTALSTSIESFALEIRHLQRTEVREVEEPFGVGQKGSSAMPHKRNPILSERLTGIARIMRGYLLASLEDVALWHERDISHSSVERVIFPDAFHLAHYATRKFKGLIGGLVVNVARMEENLLSSYGLVYSQPVLLALVGSGLSRDAAYRIVQRCAMESWKSGRQFADVLDDDPEVPFDKEQLRVTMDPRLATRNTDVLLRAIDGIEDRL